MGRRRSASIEAEGASEDQLHDALLEPVPAEPLSRTRTSRTPARAARRCYQHAVSPATTRRRARPTQTGAQVVDGKVYVNNGFWDTYRTAWPALLAARTRSAGELVDGFVQQYRDGGWVARWSSPGYANLMTGTSSDVAFADAYLKGVEGFDAQDAYDAALKNATVAPPGRTRHRRRPQGPGPSLFLGYTPNDGRPRGVSWGLEGYINDFGIANMAAALADERRRRRERRRYREEYGVLPRPGPALRAPLRPGDRLLPGPRPRRHVEVAARRRTTRACGATVRLHRDQRLELRLPRAAGRRGPGEPLRRPRTGSRPSSTRFFATPETAEAPRAPTAASSTRCSRRATSGMGQWGLSNQVSHHIPYMYDYAGQPPKTPGERARGAAPAVRRQRDRPGLRRATRTTARCRPGTSSAALGFYPLQVGSPSYAIGSPLFNKATVHLPGGATSSSTRRTTARERLRPAPARQRRGRTARRTSPDDLARRRPARLRDGPRAVGVGHGRGRRARRRSPRATSRRPVHRRHDAATARRPRATASSAARLFDNTSGSRVTFAEPAPLVPTTPARPGARSPSTR